MDTDIKKGSLIIEGKTKAVYEISGQNGLVYIEGKDRITAGDGVKAHTLEGKAAVANATNAKVFNYLREVGIHTSFMRPHGEKDYISRKCNMVPIEWVTRRVATGSFLRRNPGVKEGFRFTPVKLETFFKDDENHDPQWSKEQLIESGLKVGNVTIGRHEYDIMERMTVVVFEVLERAWTHLNCSLIDMKIEFGIDNETNEILVSDVIDSDSWRLWPSGDKRLMKDKQYYRNLQTVTDEALAQVIKNFEWVSEKLDHFIPKEKSGLVAILMGSASDKAHCENIQQHCTKVGVNSELRITSAHKQTKDTLDVVAEYEGLAIPVVFVAVAGRSNGLGPVIAANTSFPVINCPPVSKDDKGFDIWSSLNLPSGLGCSTVIYPEAAAMNAAAILGLHDHIIWSKIHVKQFKLWYTLKEADKQMVSK